MFVSVKPDIKEQVEHILEQRGIPFDMKISIVKPLTIGTMSDGQFNTEIEKGLAELSAGKIVTAKNVAMRMQEDYGV